MHYLKSLGDWIEPDVWKTTPISQMAWAMLRDSYHSHMCIRIKPQHLAVAVVYFALQCYGVAVPENDQAKKKWWQVRETKVHFSVVFFSKGGYTFGNYSTN